MQQHYIPCFYTKRWAGSDKRLVEFSRPYRKLVAKSVRPESTGFAHDLWTIPFVDGERKHLIETRLMRTIDQKASDALCKIERDKIDELTPDERMFWATFMISVVQRHPSKVAQLQNDAEKMIREIVDTTLPDDYEKRRRENDPLTLQEWLAQKESDGFFENAKVLAIQSGILLSRAIEAICKFHWGVCKFDMRKSHSLLTSDQPVFLSNGLARPEGHIAMPIAPDKLFLAARSPNLGPQLCAERRLAERLNDLTVKRARRFVYGVDSQQFNFIDRRLGNSRRSEYGRG